MLWLYFHCWFIILNFKKATIKAIFLIWKYYVKSSHYRYHFLWPGDLVTKVMVLDIKPGLSAWFHGYCLKSTRHPNQTHVDFKYFPTGSFNLKFWTHFYRFSWFLFQVVSCMSMKQWRMRNFYPLQFHGKKIVKFLSTPIKTIN